MATIRSLRFSSLLGMIALLMLLSACSSTTLRDSWYNDNYHGAPFDRVFVLAVHNTPAERRTMEDVISAAIDATGSHGIRGYQYLTRDDKAEEAHLNSAVHAANADALLMVRLKHIETRTQVTTQMAPGPAMYGWYGWYNAWYAAPSVYQYDVATVETSLFDTKTQQLIWTGTSETMNPVPVAEKAPGFAKIIIAALQARKLLPTPAGQ